ncbi:MAG: hypothetical protein AAF611_10765 [Bacteroidota bacterium]
MCEHCAGFLTERFFSAEDYAAFEKALGKKLVDGTFIRVINSNQLPQNTQETVFQCTHCGTEWVLSVPDFKDGWQGYFLPNDQLAAYEYEEVEDTSRRNDGTFQTTLKSGQKGCGFCLLMLLALIILIFYIIYSFFRFIFDFIADLLF